jgi:hypothetical protein
MNSSASPKSGGMIEIEENNLDSYFENSEKDFEEVKEPKNLVKS